jgi:N utilization substance protein B
LSSKRSEKGEARSRARAQALQMLFTRDFVDESECGPDNVTEVLDNVVIEDYAKELYDGVVSNIDAIDRTISQASENWTISRMPATDKSILRIAVYELLYRNDIPSGVSINEAVELAQHFGGEDDSYRFVNGVLGKVAKQIENGYSPEKVTALTDEELVDIDSMGEFNVDFSEGNSSDEDSGEGSDDLESDEDAEDENSDLGFEGMDIEWDSDSDEDTPKDKDPDRGSQSTREIESGD